MSVTFSTDLPALEGSEDSPCLCAQMAPAFFRFMDGEDTPDVRAELAEEASPECLRCGGKGVETVPLGSPVTYNLANENASILLRALGLSEGLGECTIAEARRSLLRARNVRLDGLTRPEEITYGSPRQNVDGVVEMHPLRSFSQGLDVEDILDRIERFEIFLRH